MKPPLVAFASDVEIHRRVVAGNLVAVDYLYRGEVRAEASGVATP